MVIATRHHAHAAMVCEALAAGKAVFVEKPLAVDPDQLRAILAAVADSGNDRLMVGFNRRFAPLLVDLKAAAGTRSGPVQVRYDVNAGRLEAGSWYGHPEEGSRLVGEGCHFVDTISWWLDEDPVAVFSAATGDPDDTASTLLYPDGSVATIAYQTGGDPRAPKELFQVSGDRQVARLHNFQRTELWRGGRRHVRRSRTGIDKGQRQELDAFVRAVAEAWAMPIPLASLAATTLATFAARRSLGSRRLEAVAADEGAAGVNLRWYARRLASMSPAEMAGRARDELTRRRWRSRQVTDAGADPTGVPAACPAFAALLPAAGDDVPEDARVRLKEAAEGLLGGRWPVFARERDDMAPAPDWFLDPDTGRRAPDRTLLLRDRPPRHRGGRQRQVRVGAVAPPAPDRAGGRLPPRRRRAVRRGRGHAAPLLVGGQPVPVRHPLDQRHRARRAAAVLGLDPPAAGRLGRGRAAVRGQPHLPAAAPPPPGVAGPAAESRVVGQQPHPGRDGRAVRRRLRVPLVPGEQRLA